MPDESCAGPDRPMVLVVEDDPDLRELLTIVIGREYRVATAANGHEGLEKAMALVPDLIVSDLMMPVMGGDQMLRELRRRSELDHVPFIIMTASPSPALRAELLRTGAQDHLVKPFSNEQLRSRVAYHLARSNGEDARNGASDLGLWGTVAT